jgi:hypothetical protein
MPPWHWDALYFTGCGICIGVGMTQIFYVVFR